MAPSDYTAALRGLHHMSTAGEGLGVAQNRLHQVVGLESRTISKARNFWPLAEGRLALSQLRAEIAEGQRPGSAGGSPVQTEPSAGCPRGSEALLRWPAITVGVWGDYYEFELPGLPDAPSPLLGGRSRACVRTAPRRVRQQLARGADSPADPLPPPLIARRPLAGLTSAGP